MPDFTTFLPIARALDASGIPWGIFAGAAIVFYGGKRPITDIDILIPSSAGARVAAALPAARCAYEQGGRVSDLHWGDVEIIAGLTRSLWFEMDAQMTARLRRGMFLEVEVSALSVEDNLALKAILGRGPEAGKRDWEDIVALLSHHTPDWDYLYWRLLQSAPARAETLLGKLQKFSGKPV